MRSFAAMSGFNSAHFFMPGLASKYVSKLQPYFSNLKLHLGFFASSSSFQLAGAVSHELFHPMSGSTGGHFESKPIGATSSSIREPVRNMPLRNCQSSS